MSIKKEISFLKWPLEALMLGTHLEIGGVLFVCRHDSVVEVGRPAPSQHQVGQAKRNLSSQEEFINTCNKNGIIMHR
jgi:hypothetical protein